MEDCDTTDVDFVNTAYRQSMELIDFVVVPIVWSVLIVTGVLGNGIVLYVMCRHGERKATNCYVINLALTDLAFIALVLPFTLMHYVQHRGWLLGDVLCKLHIYMVYVTLQATCLTLTAMTIDRYHAIVHPIRSIEDRTPRRAVLVSGAIWLVALITDAPFAFFHGVVVDCTGHFCRATWSPLAGKVMVVSVVMVTYVLPLSIIIVCYSLMIRHLYMKAGTTIPSSYAASTSMSMPAAQARSRKLRKTSKMVAAVVLLFAIFWLPIHVYQLWTTLDEDFPKSVAMYKYKFAAHVISYANSCLNPCVYSFIGDGFRKALKKAFPGLARLRARCGAAVGPATHGAGRSAAEAGDSGGGTHQRLQRGSPCLTRCGSASPVTRSSVEGSAFVSGAVESGVGSQTAAVAVAADGRYGARGSGGAQEVVLCPRPECAVFSRLGAAASNPLPSVIEV